MCLGTKPSAPKMGLLQDQREALADGLVFHAGHGHHVTQPGLRSFSFAGMVLTTECIVADLSEKKEAAPAGGGMGGGDFDY
jgi:hypothetical protein